MWFGEYDSLGDVLSDLYNYFVYPFWYEWRQFFFFSPNRQQKIFFFFTIPLALGAIEALCDFIIPTLLDCQPLLIRRFFIPKAEKFNLPEAKLFKVSEGKIFKSFKTPTLFIKHNIIKPFSLNKKYESLDLKYYRTLYCQRYNRFPKPMELKKFALAEAKGFNEKKYWYPPQFNTKWSIKRFKSFDSEFGHKDKDDYKEKIVTVYKK